MQQSYVHLALLLKHHLDPTAHPAEAVTAAKQGWDDIAGPDGAVALPRFHISLLQLFDQWVDSSAMCE
jgi:hypothetical protein